MIASYSRCSCAFHRARGGTFSIVCLNACNSVAASGKYFGATLASSSRASIPLRFPASSTDCIKATDGLTKVTLSAYRSAAWVCWTANLITFSSDTIGSP